MKKIHCKTSSKLLQDLCYLFALVIFGVHTQSWINGHHNIVLAQPPPCLFIVVTTPADLCCPGNLWPPPLSVFRTPSPSAVAGTIGSMVTASFPLWALKHALIPLGKKTMAQRRWPCRLALPCLGPPASPTRRPCPHISSVGLAAVVEEVGVMPIALVLPGVAKRGRCLCRLCPTASGST